MELPTIADLAAKPGTQRSPKEFVDSGQKGQRFILLITFKQIASVDQELASLQMTPIKETFWQDQKGLQFVGVGC